MLACLRSDLPAAYAFSVTELPCQAKLDQNETAVDLPAELKHELMAELAARPWNRYVQPAEYMAAKAALAAVFGLPAESVALMSGADQAIEAAFMIAGGPGRRARIFEPTYPYLAHAARRTSTMVDAVHLGVDIDSMLTPERVAAAPRPELIALVSPNNPTGGLVAESVVGAALADDRSLVFVDEAYAELSGHSFASWVPAHANLVLARSLSKSLLAGVHLGFIHAHPEIIALVERMYTAPYHLNVMQLQLARRYGDVTPHVRAAAADVLAERERMSAALAAMDEIEPRPSRANFILFAVAGEPARARRVSARLAAAGVRIRDVGGVVGLEGYLRVTVGTAAENQLFLSALSSAVAITRQEG